MRQHHTQTGLTCFVENNPNLPVTLMAELLEEKPRSPVPLQNSSVATLPLPALMDGYETWPPCPRPHGSPTDLPSSAGCSRRLPTLSGEGYSDQKHVLVCHKTRRCFLLPPPSPRSWAVSPVLTTALQPHGGWPRRPEAPFPSHPSKVAPPHPLRAWEWTGGDLHGHDRNNHNPEGSGKALSAGTQPYPVTWDMSSLPLLCHDGARCSEQSNAAPLPSVPRLIAISQRLVSLLPGVGCFPCSNPSADAASNSSGWTNKDYIRCLPTPR